MIVEQIGAVVGASAISEALSSSKAEETALACDLFTGWAMGNPTAAVEWFQQQAPEIREEFFTHLLTGLGRSDPKQALGLLVGRPQEIWERNTPAILEG